MAANCVRLNCRWRLRQRAQLLRWMLAAPASSRWGSGRDPRDLRPAPQTGRHPSGRGLLSPLPCCRRGWFAITLGWRAEAVVSFTAAAQTHTHTLSLAAFQQAQSSWFHQITNLPGINYIDRNKRINTPPYLLTHTHTHTQSDTKAASIKHRSSGQVETMLRSALIKQICGPKKAQSLQIFLMLSVWLGVIGDEANNRNVIKANADCLIVYLTTVRAWCDEVTTFKEERAFRRPSTEHFIDYQVFESLKLIHRQCEMFWFILQLQISVHDNTNRTKRQTLQRNLAPIWLADWRESAQQALLTLQVWT